MSTGSNLQEVNNKRAQEIRTMAANKTMGLEVLPFSFFNVAD